MIEQRQVWQSLIRYIIMTEHSSVQLELYNEPRGDDKVTAYIWALWTDKDFRLKGRAARLLHRAEALAREAGHEYVWLEWDRRDTPLAVFKWYERMGYQEVSFGRDNSLLKKKLK